MQTHVYLFNSPFHKFMGYVKNYKKVIYRYKMSYFISLFSSFITNKATLYRMNEGGLGGFNFETNLFSYF